MQYDHPQYYKNIRCESCGRGNRVLYDIGLLCPTCGHEEAGFLVCHECLPPGTERGVETARARANARLN